MDVGGLLEGGGRKNSLHPICLRSVANEDVDVTYWDDAAPDSVVVCRHKGIVVVDVVIAAILDGAANGDGFADAANRSYLENDACRLLPHDGRQLSSYRHC